MLINLLTATGDELDRAGAIHEKKRRDGEPDEAFRKRLIDDEPSDGGPAFGEFTRTGQYSIKTGGITVRDYFAGQALIACRNHSSEKWLAERAYKIADAMLAARGESK